MSARVNAVQWQCDWCSAISEEVPLAPSGIIVESRLPDGWESVGYGSIQNVRRFVELKDVFGAQISTLCPSCCQRPATELLKHLAGLGVPEKANAD